MPFTPTDIPNLWAWYNGDNVVITSGSLIDSLTDLSGNGRTATVGNPLHKASRVSSALNGHAVIANNGTDGSAYVTAGNLPLLDANDLTVFVVAKKVSGDASISRFLYSPSGFAMGEGYNTDNNKVGGESGNGSPLTYALKPVSNNTYYTMRLRVVHGGNYYFAVNNGTESSAAQGSSFSAGPLVVFDDVSSKADAEILVYVGNLTGNNQLEVEYFLQQKYNHYTWSGALPASANPTTAVINFPALPTKHVGDADFAPGATSNSPATITYTSSDTSVATIVGGQIHIVGVGICQITASQGSTTGYTAATNVIRTLTVNSNISNTNTMATNEIQGDIVGIYLSTVLSNPQPSDWKEIVCGENIGMDGTRNVNTKRTKCGVIKGFGPADFKITGSGTANSAPGTGKVSANNLLAYFTGETPLLVKIEYATDSTLFNRHASGQLTSYKETANTGETIDFDFTLDVIGNVTIV